MLFHKASQYLKNDGDTGGITSLYHLAGESRHRTSARRLDRSAG